MTNPTVSSREAERDALMRKKRADRRKSKRAQKSGDAAPVPGTHRHSEKVDSVDDDFEIEYIPEPISAEYDSLMAKFAPVEHQSSDEVDASVYSSNMDAIMDEDAQRKAADAAAAVILESSAISNRDKRMAARMSLAALKASVDRPDLVDTMDNCSPEPLLLQFCKGYRNTVQVPRHWSNKRNYLANKRGIDKQVFKLPEYVEQTGIAKIRQALLQKEAEKDIKAKQRAKVRPKTGKLDIDYQVLYNAFFKYQTKPAHMTKFGDVYYEGREAETRYAHKRPGQISSLLREALGMIEGSPPPWLINMQRFGPPPSYPHLKIAGLNSPIPTGAEWGYHPGGWGKAPVDEYGNPIYGGLWNPEKDRSAIVDMGNLEARKNLWGEFRDESSDDEDDDVMDVVPVATQAPPVQPQYSQGVAVTLHPPVAQFQPGIVPTTTSSGSLYRVLPQASAPTQPGALFPSRNIYDLKASDSITGGVATDSGIAQRAQEVDDQDIITADMVKKRLEEHEAVAAKSSQAAKPAKKKQKFKF